ncbi:LIM and calponin homology domains-containing protein 1 isoform X2 [Bombina bombina]|uniref:LIM and calponin homology domains-containing protein 1 isoform X2 n=1 Tax=Bombina bombina TaxID=8345 RepID=UPI00235B1974|nr:LIM and calponin homology domains-containing protein 1 isoform X2 [Bombina bombina]
MASPALDLQDIAQPQESPPDSACKEAQKWIEQVTGRSFGDKDFRTGLENGILLCELLNAIKPGLVKKINRLPTPIAGLDNLTLFLRGCKELGLKESQLFDPGDLQDTSNRTTLRTSDCSRKLRNVLVTVYWLGKVANSCSSYDGKNLDLKEFEGLLAQMRKENEEIESPKRSIRDSGYIDCWDSERSDSLSPPRHGRDDSFDSLDSFGSRSQQTPSPDVVLRGSSDGRGSDSESDVPHRRIPDVRKDDMSARRVSFGENKAFVPFNQYLPNKGNHTAYIPAPLRKKKAEREDYRKSWSTATSPLGGERPFSQHHPETIKEEHDLHCGEDGINQDTPCDLYRLNVKSRVQMMQAECVEKVSSPVSDIPKSIEEDKKLKNLEQAGIRVRSASKRYGSQRPSVENSDVAPDIVLRKENAFLMSSDSENEEEDRVPDIERDDLATRRARMNQPKPSAQFNHYIHGSYVNKKTTPQEVSSTASSVSSQHTTDKSETDTHQEVSQMVVCKEEKPFESAPHGSDTEEEEEKVPDIKRDDLAKRKTQGTVSQKKDSLVFVTPSMTKADMEKWQRLKVSSEDSETDNLVTKHPIDHDTTSSIDVARAANDDFGRRKLSLQEKRARNKQKFVHFGPVTEIDQKRWDRLCIAKPAEESEEGTKEQSATDVLCVKAIMSETTQSYHNVESTITVPFIQKDSRMATSDVSRGFISPAPPESEDDGLVLDTQRDDMLARRTGVFQKFTRLNKVPPVSSDQNLQDSPTEQVERVQEIIQEHSEQLSRLLLSAAASNNLSGKTSVSTVEMDSLTKTKAFAVEQNGSEGDLTEKETSAPNPEKDDMMCRRISISQKPVGIGLSPFLPIPFSVQQKEVDKPNTSSLKENKLSAVPSRSVVSNNPPHALESVRCDSPTKPLYQSETEEHVDLRDDQTYLEIHDSVQTNSEGNTNCTHLKTQLEETLEISDHELRFSSRSAMSDDTESVSMCDMRYEGEAILLPHSRLHQEHLQNVNDMLKEEDDTWQDDLARWKTRRRSASQDLLKKEEERKKMERLLSGDYDLSERRKSIKTYKEIVEEKERREKQLHEAYKNAKSKAEAEKILQKYIERFTISEAVLERLVMPKILERSHSVEPSLLSSSEDPNPLKYLRQQSLPSSKYTATVEATIASNMDTFVKATPDRTSPNKGLSKAVPMLTPKPYSQPKNTQQILKTFKVDGKISMNGEACNGIEEQKESMRFSQPLSRSQRFEGVARVDAAIEEMKFNSATCVDLNSSRPSLQNSFSDLKSFSKEANHTAQREEINCTGKTERFHSEQELKKVNKQPHDATKGGATVTSLEFTPSAPTKDPAVNGKEFEERQKVDAQALIMHWTLEQKEGALPQFSGVPEDAQKLPQRNQLVEAACSEDLPAPATSVNSSSRFCSWDPEEERKRQERWQQEQERLLQERYQKEQEKLKEEWEKAQKEVEEEERKYYEEERKIIEDTVMPLTVSPTSCVLLYDSERIGNSHSVTKEHEQSAQEDNRGTEQSALWAQEGAHCVSEEQLKGKLNVSTVEVDSVMRVKESEPANVSSMKEYSTPNRLTLQLGQQVASAEAPLPGDIGNTVQRNISPVATRGTDSQENICGSGYSSQPSSSQCPSPNRYKRSVSGKKLCSTCGLPLGKGAAMIIETLSLYFHIQCFKCGICKGQLGDATTGTDVRIRNGLLNCNDCYMKSRTAGHPTPL